MRKHQRFSALVRLWEKRISEAPVRDYYVDDSVMMPGSTWDKRDKAILDSPKTEVLARKRIRTSVNLDMTFVGLKDKQWLDGDGKMSSEFDRILQMHEGVIDSKDLDRLFGVRIRPSADAITVVYLSNTQDVDTAVPMTPWIMMHRLAHALLEKSIFGIDFLELSDVISSDFFTMKTGRNPDSMVTGEHMIELMTQYLHNGSIKFARAVSNNVHGEFNLSNNIVHLADDPDMSRIKFNYRMALLEVKTNKTAKALLNQVIGKIVLAP